MSRTDKRDTSGKQEVKDSLNNGRRILTYLNKSERKLLLDVGCGTGKIAGLSRALGVKVHAFDISPGLMNLTYKRMMREGLEEDILLVKNLGLTAGQTILRPKLWVGDASQAINYISGPYSAIACNEGTLEFVLDPVRAIALLTSALEKNGRLFLEIESKQHAFAIKEAFCDILRFKFKTGFNKLRDICSMKPVERVRIFNLKDGQTRNVPVKLVSVAIVEKAAAANGCRLKIVKGDTWLQELTLSPFFGKETLQSGLSWVAPFNRLSKSVWIEIEKISD